jgi:hypothetical protein
MNDERFRGFEPTWASNRALVVSSQRRQVAWPEQIRAHAHPK